MLLFQESFDDYNFVEELWVQKKVRAVARGLNYAASGGAFGGGKIQASTALVAGMLAPFPLIIPSNHARIALWFKSNQAGSATGSRPIFGITNFTTGGFWNFYNNGAAGASKLGACRFGNNTIVANSAITIGDDAWHHIEMNLIVGNVGGVCDVWIDGVADTAISTFMAGDTYASGTGNLMGSTHIQFCGVSTNPAAIDIHVDDLIVWDDTGSGFTGHLSDLHRIRRNSPSSDGAFSGWTPSSGVNYQCVDEKPQDNDTTYVETDTVGDVDLYQVGGLGYVPGTVYAAVIEATAKRTGLKAMNVKGLCELGGTTIDNTVAIVHPNYQKSEHIFELAPDGADWNAAKILACEFGMEYDS